MELTTANVEQAVTVFYQTTAGVMQAHSHKWLLEAQSSPQAWSFVWELLRPDKSGEVQFFAATTLHLKIRRSWHEVPGEQYPQLKKQLLEVIASYCLGPKIVLNRLCIALSAYILHTLPTCWPDAITELLATFSPSNVPSVPPERTVWILLQILTVLPEEFRTTDLAQNRTALVRNQLTKNATQVLSLVEDLLASNLSQLQPESAQESAQEMCQQAALCAAAWLELGVAPHECLRLAEQLLSAVYVLGSKGQTQGLVDAALTAVSNMVLNPIVHQYPSTCLKLIGHLLPLHDIILTHQQLPRDQQNEDLPLSFYAVLIAVAETHCRLLLNTLLESSESTADALKLIDIVLQCSDAPGVYPTQETSSALAFGFWFMLQDEMLAMEPEQHQRLQPLIAPVYHKLAKIMLHKSVLHDATDTSWSKDDEEMLRCYRQDVTDTLMYCYCVLRSDLLHLMAAHLDDAISASRIHASSWPLVEACLHGFHAVAECVGVEENVYLPQLLHTIQKLAVNSVDMRVVASALDAIGAYSEWINAHPEVLSTVVPILVMGLGNAVVVPSASMALKDLSRDCQLSLVPFAHHILQACQAALNAGQLKHNESERIMFIVGRVLAVLPGEDIMNYLNQMLVPYVRQLELLAQDQPGPASNAAILFTLRMLKTLFGTLDTRLVHDQVPHGTQPVFHVVHSVIPVLHAVVLKWYNVMDIIEAVCLTLKRAVSTLVDDTRPLLAQLLDILLASFRLQPNAHVLQLARQFALLYATDEPAIIQALLAELCNTTARLLLTGGPVDAPDLADEMLGLLTQVVKKSPALLAGIDVDMAVRCACKALRFQESAVIKASSLFLVHLIGHSREEAALKQVVQAHIQELLITVLACIGGSCPRAAVDHFSTILLALNKKYADDLKRLLPHVLSQDGFPSPRVSRQNNADFSKAMLRERANRRKLQDIVREYSLLCRGLIGSDYASQTASNLVDH